MRVSFKGLVAMLGLMTSVASQPAWTQDAAPQAAPAAPAAVSDESYLIGPGDTLQIFVWQHPDLSMTIPVRPDGKISTPLVDDMVAVGKTPGRLATDIQTRLAEYIRTPQVSVIVTNPAGAFGQVKVIGQVRTPSGFAYREGLRVLDVVLLAGGVTEFAAPNRSKLIRMQNGVKVEKRIRIGDLLEKGRIEENLLLQPGDVIVVPQSMF
ncbi:MAG: polysaccharide biosynthesis/export family protein [Gammaproteobacteria bacterium]|nr:polysaccharide biosynthesis/export family protein [Gammaproteobacteria bacterium]